MGSDQRNHPPGLGDMPIDDIAEKQFRARIAGQDSNRKPHEVAPNADAGPDHPQVNHPEEKDTGKRTDHAFRGGAGHAQSPVWGDKDK